jgi:hypothetical protein
VEKKIQIQQLGWGLTVWENDEAQVRLLLEHPVDPKNPLMRSHETMEFLGENALGDAEEWLSEVIGYPNPFRGLIEFGESDELVEWQNEVQHLYRTQGNGYLRELAWEHSRFLAEHGQGEGITDYINSLLPTK